MGPTVHINTYLVYVSPFLPTILGLTWYLVWPPVIVPWRLSSSRLLGPARRWLCPDDWCCAGTLTRFCSIFFFSEDDTKHTREKKRVYLVYAVSLLGPLSRYSQRTLSLHNTLRTREDSVIASSCALRLSTPQGLGLANQ